MGKILLLTTTTCPHCQTMKSIVSKQIDNGKITLIDENNPKFVELVTEKHVGGVPTFFVDGNECDFTGTDTDPKLTCDGKEVQL